MRVLRAQELVKRDLLLCASPSTHGGLFPHEVAELLRRVGVAVRRLENAVDDGLVDRAGPLFRNRSTM